MKLKHSSFECSKCKIKWQEWTSYAGTHQTFNKFAFEDYKNPEIKVCNICKSKDVVSSDV